MRSNKLILRSLTIVAALAPASAAAQGADSPLFETDVLPIFEARCASCHSPEAEEIKGGLDLMTFASTLKGGNNGASIVPGDSAKSSIIGMIEWRTEPFMPPKNYKRLTADEIEVIKKWIDAGALGEGAKAEPAMPKPEPAPAKPAEPATPSAESTPSTPSTASINPSPVSALAFSPDGKLIAKGSLHTLELIPLEGDTPGAPVKLSGHAELVRAARFSPDGKLVAAAGGKPARGGEIKIWNVADGSLVREIKGHADAIYDIAFSPDGKRLASCSYDKLVKIWNVETGEEAINLKDHVDGVFCLAFSPDGKRLASGAGDRTVKIWDAETGQRIVTLSDSLDAVFSVAFSPDGKRVAAGGADKMIRVWDIDRTLGSFTQSSVTGSNMIKATFAHDAALLRLAYTPDGKRMITTSEDRTIKIWNTETMLEEKAIPGQSDWVMSMALSPDGARLAVGRYDATAEILDVAEGRAVTQIGRAPDERAMTAAEPKAEAPARKKVTNIDVENVVINARIPCSLQSVSPGRIARGTTITMELRGISLDDPEIIITHPAIKARLVSNEKLPIPELKRSPGETGAFIIDNAQPHKLTLEVAIASDTPVGTHFVMLRNAAGITNPMGFQIAAQGDAGEAEPNEAADKAQALEIPRILNGSIGMAGDVDRYRFHAAAGREIVFAMTDAGLTAPTMRILAADGAPLVSSERFGGDPRSPRVAHRFAAEGDYTLEITEKGLGTGGYRLHAGEFPFVTSVFPLGVQAGGPQKVRVEGFNLGGAREIEVDPPDTAGANEVMRLPIPGYEGSPIEAPVIGVSADPQSLEREPNDLAALAMPVEAPATIDGVIAAPAAGAWDEDTYRFKATKGQKLIIEVVARRLNSPLDSYLEILDAGGAPLERATIRCVSETVMSLSDRDSRGAGIRLADWTGLKIFDHVMIGSEILRVRAIPDYGDEDVQFDFYPSGQRKGYFGTTPQFHAVDSKVYKVEAHPPGMDFPPNGMPVFHINWVNDDTDFEGFRAGDSWIEFVAPEDGEYLARVSDANRGGGADFAYRLQFRPERPDFDIVAGPYWVNIAEGDATPINVRARRKDHFDEPVEVWAEGVPEGYEITSDVILSGDDDCALALRAKPGAAPTKYGTTFVIKAKSKVNGQEVTREARIGDIAIRRNPDIAIAADKKTLETRPGEPVWVTAKLTRRSEFNNRVPIDVLNLPFGVYVLDTGLNGILVRDGETERPMQIYVEPWAKPMTRKIYLQARIESRSTQPTFISEPIELKILQPEGEEKKPGANVAVAGE